jgi:hypothetical protein
MQKTRLFIILLAAFVLSGCGAKGLNTNYVEGIVTLDGDPLEQAVVTFFPVIEDGKVATGTTDETGKYMLTADGGAPLKGALEGDYVVTVRKVETTITEKVPLPGDPQANRNDPGYRPETVANQRVITPQIYAQQRTSPLKATVVKGKNDLPFELKSR